MLIEIILFLLLGIFAGTITGLIPGIHINLIGALVVALSLKFYFFENIYLITFVTAMAITHTFLDFVPSIFLGCPDTDTELSILPGHRLLKSGLGYSAIVLTAYGSLAAIFLLLLITPLSIKLTPLIYLKISKIIPFILILVSGILIFLEQKKFTALFIFTLTGILGFIVLKTDFNQPLFPLLTGLFGASTLIKSIKSKTQIPKQILIKPKLKSFKPFFGALIASPLCSFLPGLGSGQAAVIGNLLTFEKNNENSFLVLLGATNTLVMGFSFISLYAISKTRTGAALAVQEIVGSLNFNEIILILGVILISGLIAFYLTLIFAKIFSTNISKLNYSILSYITLTILILIVFFVSGIIGLLVLIASTLTGIYCISFKVRRTHMMGCLLIPTILLYFGF